MTLEVTPGSIPSADGGASRADTGAGAGSAEGNAGGAHEAGRDAGATACAGGATSAGGAQRDGAKSVHPSLAQISAAVQGHPDIPEAVQRGILAMLSTIQANPTERRADA